MKPRIVKPLRIALAAFAFVSAAAPVHAAMYKWIDEEGSVTYSNQPPPEPSKVRELTKIDAAPLPAPDKRPVESAGAQQERRTADIVTVNPPDAQAQPQEASVSPEPVASPEAVLAAPQVPAPPTEIVIIRPEPTVVKPEAATIRPEPPAVRPDPATARREAEIVPRAPIIVESEAPRRVIPRPTHTQAVQDPCLTSSDPQCHKKQSANYHPYLGYAPGAGSQATPATGATSAAGADGSVAGSGSAPPAGAYIPPRRSQTEARTTIPKPQWK